MLSQWKGHREHAYKLSIIVITTVCVLRYVLFTPQHCLQERHGIHCGTEYTSSAWLSSAESFLWNLGSVTNQSLDWKLSSNYKTSVSYSWSWFPAYPRCRVNGSTSHQFSFIYHLWLWLIHVYLPGDSASEVMHVLCKRLIAKSHGNRWRNTAYLKRWIIVIALF